VKETQAVILRKNSVLAVTENCVGLPSPYFLWKIEQTRARSLLQSTVTPKDGIITPSLIDYTNRITDF
jgi:hypothetical protein